MSETTRAVADIRADLTAAMDALEEYIRTQPAPTTKAGFVPFDRLIGRYVQLEHAWQDAVLRGMSDVAQRRVDDAADNPCPRCGLHGRTTKPNGEVWCRECFEILWSPSKRPLAEVQFASRDYTARLRRERRAACNVPTG